MLGGMWRSALPVDDEAMVGMCVALNAEDPGPASIIRRWLAQAGGSALHEPNRSRALTM